MKRCPKCGYTIQADAKFCPYCSAPQSESRAGSGTLLLIIAGAVTLVAIAGSMTRGNREHSPATTETATATNQQARHEPTHDSDVSGSKYADVGKQYAWIESGKDQIKTRLKDADSAKFRNVHFYSGGGVPVTCGEVNAKNSFGSYRGFERLIAAGSQLAVLESDMPSSSELDQVWQRFCSNAPSDEA